MTYSPVTSRPRQTAADTSTTASFGASRRKNATQVESHEFTADVIEGLSQTPKRLHCKHLYDRRGSQLFDQICELSEYYPTRTELAIMNRNVDAIADQIGSNATLVELGSGSSQKTRILLDHLREPAAYLPVDISRGHLLETATRLRVEHPGLDIHPLVADFTQPIQIPPSVRGEKVCVYFPGSTIGNLESQDALKLFRNIHDLVGPKGGLLIGFDLQKDTDVLHAAYNDSQGITAAFNLNLLHRINREACGEFNVSQFEHLAVYDQTHGRIEISIVSTCDQTTHVAGHKFHFIKGERIHTEYSHKYTIEGFRDMAAATDFTAREVWTDEREWFAVMYLESNDGN
ncbi:L-histidine N(alpha)-methyltransferase [Aporhodopirellula aestuarii]|uniref:L-histidine N(Alpha)-methyltransferase n=1 Tax=Aporhodopirellula aestuarii TaxID=2950107 RepID=A0ABT0U0U6_9BACT|nr:L-histidine N(alpha)-methyltransferase [Aporhodopirellula aestuarii]MCM2370470.1 L-histidine N(alpha)-methyltransferase [Aporhodopirellula aestuarii]